MKGFFLVVFNLVASIAVLNMISAVSGQSNQPNPLLYRTFVPQLGMYNQPQTGFGGFQESLGLQFPGISPPGQGTAAFYVGGYVPPPPSPF